MRREKASLPVDVRRSKTLLLKLPNTAEIQKKIAYLGYSDKLRIQSKSQQRLWKLREE